jgi:hypothetical protein
MTFTKPVDGGMLCTFLESTLFRGLFLLFSPEELIFIIFCILTLPENNIQWILPSRLPNQVLSTLFKPGVLLKPAPIYPLSLNVPAALLDHSKVVIRLARYRPTGAATHLTAPSFEAAR